MINERIAELGRTLVIYDGDRSSSCDPQWFDADYYRAHADETKARAKAYYWKMKNDPTFKAKRAAQARARYQLKKGKTK